MNDTFMSFRTHEFSGFMSNLTLLGLKTIRQIAHTQIAIVIP